MFVNHHQVELNQHNWILPCRVLLSHNVASVLIPVNSESNPPGVEVGRVGIYLKVHMVIDGEVICRKNGRNDPQSGRVSPKYDLGSEWER